MSGVVCVVWPFADDEKLKNIHVDLALSVWGPATVRNLFYNDIFLDVLFKRLDGDRRLSRCLPNTSTFVPNDRLQLPHLLYVFLRCFCRTSESTPACCESQGGGFPMWTQGRILAEWFFKNHSEKNSSLGSTSFLSNVRRYRQSAAPAAAMPEVD